MSELYGVQGRIGASIADTPVKVVTELVFIGITSSDEKVFTPIRASKKQDLIDNYGDVDLKTLGECAKYAFEDQRLDHAWFINLGGSGINSEADVAESDFDSALDAVDSIFLTKGVVPNLICLPYTYKYTFEAAKTACARALAISEKFYAQVVFDQGLDATNIKTLPSGYRLDETSTLDKDCAAYNGISCLGNVVWEKDEDYNVVKSTPLSIVCSVLRTVQDAKNQGEVPSRSVGNLDIPGCVGYSAVYQDTDYKEVYITQYESHNNEWTSRGFILARNKGGLQFTTWGDHTAAFAEPYSGDELHRFDSSVAMQFHEINRFCIKWGGIIDNPITLNVRNMIISSEQDYLNKLVSYGALIGNPVVEFRAIDNTNDTMLQGQFYFRGVTTTCIPLKFLDLNLVWTADGLKTLISE